MLSLDIKDIQSWATVSCFKVPVTTVLPRAYYGAAYYMHPKFQELSSQKS